MKSEKDNLTPQGGNFPQTLSDSRAARLLPEVIFFTCFYLYVWLEVDTRLIYHGGGLINTFPVFYRSWAFFLESISHPGGLTEYVSALAAQFFYYSWAGAGVATLQAYLLCLCTGDFIKLIQAPRLALLRFIPPIVMLVTYNLYTYHLLSAMAFLAAITAVCLYLRIAPKRSLRACFVFLALSVAVYTIAGGAYLFFALLCAIYEMLFARNWLRTAVYLLIAAVIPYIVGVHIFGIAVVNAFTELLPFSEKIFDIPFRIVLTAVYIIYLLPCAAALGVGLWRLCTRGPGLPGQTSASWGTVDSIKSGKKHEKRSKKPSITVPTIMSAYLKKLKWAAEACVLVAVGWGTMYLFDDEKTKTMFAVDYHNWQKDWSGVLAGAASGPNTEFIAHAVNRALYHTGRLNSEMFRHPQHPAALFLIPGEPVGDFKKIDTYIELGFINIAEHDLNESMEMLGERPVILERLGLVNMVKGNIGGARVYLGALSKTLFHARWANDYLRRIDADPNLDADQQVQHLRTIMFKNDYGFADFSSLDVLACLLERNTKNRMLFEYQMAFYLLTKQLDKLVENLDGLNDFNYPQIPPLWEQAILIYNSFGTAKRVNLYGRQISLKSRQQYANFVRAYRRYRFNKAAAMNELATDYGDSYFFYHTYEFSGRKK